MKVLISGVFGTTATGNPLFAAIADGMQSLGHDVHRFDACFMDRAAAWEKAVERLVTVPVRMAGLSKDIVKHLFPWSAMAQREQALLADVAKVRPDVLLVMSFVRYRPQVLQRCRDLGVKKLVGWFLEGPEHDFRVEDECFLYDRYFSIHRHIEPELCARVGWLPAICLNTDIYQRLPDVATQERIVFVGARSQRRATFLKALNGLPLDIWGPGGWNSDHDLSAAFRGEAIWGAQLNALYNASAIVLNISSWDPKLGGLTQRVIDVPATGAFLLTDDGEDLRQIMEPGQQLDVFDSPQALRERCEHYLVHRQQRQRIARAGHARALQFDSSASLAARLLT